MPYCVGPDLQQEVATFLANHEESCRVIGLEPGDETSRMAREVAEGLSVSGQKSLPCTYFYDQRGSALYEQITNVSEYYPTRTEAALLKQFASDIASKMPWDASSAETLARAQAFLESTFQEQAPQEVTANDQPATSRDIQLVELGSGMATKTRILLNDWLSSSRRQFTYIPVDVSAAMLEETAHDLTREYPDLKVLGLAAQYEEAMALLPSGVERLFLFLGGTIGNFPPDFQQRFFADLRRWMGPGSHLLLGFDRRPHAHKPVTVIERAYNDAQGITSAFNLNILTHINERLGGNFDVSLWRHRAIYNESLDQIEMYLESLVEQRVFISALAQEFSFASGERILTEVSRKFDPETLTDWFAARGYTCRAAWSDANQWFSLMLLQT